MNLIEPTQFEDCFTDQPSRPALADDLARAQRYRRASLVRRGWSAGLAGAAGVTVLAVAVALASPVTTQTAVPAAPPEPSASSSAAQNTMPLRNEIPAQQRVDKALAPMSKIVKNDGADDPHYASSTVSAEDQTATIYWKGEVPKVLRDLEGTTATGVKVSIIPADYSQRDASTAADLLFAAGRRGSIPLPTRAGLSNTGDALVVGFSRATFDQYGEQALSRDVRSITDMRFRLIQGEVFQGGPALVPATPLSAATIAGLRAQGTELTVVESDRPSDAAVKAAGDRAGRGPAEVSLARATIRDHTQMSSADPAGKLLIADRLVWVLVFSPERQYYSGPAPEPGSSGSFSGHYRSVRVVLIVDAETNKVVREESV